MKKFIVFLLMVGACAFLYSKVRNLWVVPVPPVQRTNRREKAPTNPPLHKKDAPELLAAGEALLEAHRIDEAEKLFQQAVTDFPDTYAAKRAAFHLAEIYVKCKQVSKTKEMLAKCEGAITEAEKQRLGQNLADLQRGIRPSAEEPVKPDLTYVIQPGDNLIKIARKHDTKAEILRLANNLSRDLIRTGDQLTISYAYPKVVISKSQLKLFVYFKGQMVRQYPVGIGKDGLTPTDNFVAGDGPEWDTIELAINVPAGETELTI